MLCYDIVKQYSKKLENMKWGKNMALTDSELKVLKVLWKNDEMSASEIAKIMSERFQWKTTTTYTILKICFEKNLITKRNPHYICSANISKENVQHMKMNDMMNKYFDGSSSAFLNAFVENISLEDEDVQELQNLVAKLKK